MECPKITNAYNENCPADRSKEFGAWFANATPYSYFCNAEEKNSIIVNESMEASDLKNSCFFHLSELNSGL